MKLTIGIVFWLLALPGVVWAESRLVFPKVYSVAELRTTGFAVVNPSSTNATVLFSLYLPNPGVGLATGGRLLYQSSWTVLAKSQLSKLGSDLFPSIGGRYPNEVAVSPGWVEVTTEVTGLQGFWIGGDFATYTDGAGAAPLGTQLIFPLVAAQTEINVANVSHAPVIGPNVTFHLVGKSGRDLAQAVPRSIYAYGAYQGRVSDLFGNLDFSEAMYIRVDATITIAGTEVVRGFLVKTESAVLNAVNVVGGQVLNFVHAVSGSTGIVNYTTMVGIINLASAAQTVRISFNSEPSGNAIAVERSLPPNGVLRESAQSLLGFSSEFQNGWIQVSGSSPRAVWPLFRCRPRRKQACFSTKLLACRRGIPASACSTPQLQTPMLRSLR